jgi:hypothetical protein
MGSMPANKALQRTPSFPAASRKPYLLRLDGWPGEARAVHRRRTPRVLAEVIYYSEVEAGLGACFTAAVEEASRPSRCVS